MTSLLTLDDVALGDVWIRAGGTTIYPNDDTVGLNEKVFNVQLWPLVSGHQKNNTHFIKCIIFKNLKSTLMDVLNKNVK